MNFIVGITKNNRAFRALIHHSFGGGIDTSVVKPLYFDIGKVRVDANAIDG